MLKVIRLKATDTSFDSVGELAVKVVASLRPDRPWKIVAIVPVLLNPLGQYYQVREADLILEDGQ